MKKLVRMFPLVLAPGLALAQAGLDPTEILKPLRDQWTTYSGDYSGKRYSTLTEINQSNVKSLSLAWVTRFTAGSGPTGAGNAGGGGFGVGAQRSRYGHFELEIARCGDGLA